MADIFGRGLAPGDVQRAYARQQASQMMPQGSPMDLRTGAQRGIASAAPAPQQKGILGSLGGAIEGTLGAATNRNMMPWLSMAFGPTRQAQFDGMMGGIEYGDKAGRDEERLGLEQAADARGDKLFSLKMEEYEQAQAERAMESKRRRMVAEALLPQLQGTALANMTPPQIEMALGDPSGRSMIEGALKAANAVNPIQQKLQNAEGALGRPLTPEERQRLAIGASGQTINVGAAKPKDFVDAIEDERQSAQAALQTVTVTNEALRLLNTGNVTTGSLAETRNAANKFLALVGAPPITGGNPEETDTYVALLGREVATVIKEFGAGTGLSDADREYAAKISAGSIAADVNALRRLLGHAQTLAAARVQRYEQSIEPFLARPENDVWGGFLRLSPGPEPLSSSPAGSGVIDFTEFQ
jgi:hypothetical protein